MKVGAQELGYEIAAVVKSAGQLMVDLNAYHTCLRAVI